MSSGTHFVAKLQFNYKKKKQKNKIKNHITFCSHFIFLVLCYIVIIVHHSNIYCLSTLLYETAAIILLFVWCRI